MRPASKYIGKALLGWVVLFRCGWKVTARGQRLGLFRLRCEGCGAETERTSVALGTMAGNQRAGNKSGFGCVRCYRRRVRVQASLRVCKWDGSFARSGEECDACWQRARRNGRDHEGRPLGRSMPAWRAKQADRRIRERLVWLAERRRAEARTA